MKIDKIINEEINKYISSIIAENGYFEADSNKTNNNDSENGSKPHGYEQMQSELETKHDNGELNYRKLAAEMYGLSTSTKDKKMVNKLNSKASALRKKIKGEEAANGGHFHLTAKDATNISKQLS